MSTEELTPEELAVVRKLISIHPQLEEVANQRLFRTELRKFIGEWKVNVTWLMFFGSAGYMLREAIHKWLSSGAPTP